MTRGFSQRGFGRLTRREHTVPRLNTAALPDLIFTVLFFFMIVTHMRDVKLRVHYDVPNGTQLEKLIRKSAVRRRSLYQLLRFMATMSQLASELSSHRRQLYTTS